MKNVNLKAFAYSLLLSVLYFVVVLTLERNNENVAGALILFVLFFASSMIILWDNKPMIFYFWNGKHDFVTSADRLLMVLLGTVIYISGRYIFYMYRDEGTIYPLGCLMCITAAIAFREVYLNHAPDDMEQYERQRRQEEENETFVTVAECKDVESAHIIRDLLESNGIEAITFGESSPAFLGNVPVRVLTRRKDKEAAEKLINE